jgi:type II secretory pathway pseudopilin PulG
MTFRPGLRIFLAVAVLAVTGAGLRARPGAAQEATTLQERELAYRAALSAYRAALDAREVVESLFNREMREVRAARGTDRADQAWDEFYRAQAELTRMDRRVERELERVEEAGRAFLAALDDRREELLARADTLPPAEAEDIALLLLDLRNQIEEVDGELSEAREPLAPTPPDQDQITLEPDDTRQDLELKAQILEDRAARYDSTVVDLDREIDQLVERRRNDRRVRDLVASLDRFDDRALPVVPRRSEGGGGAEVGAEGQVSDTTALDAREMTLEARIDNLESLRERLVQYRNLILEQARLVRERLGTGGMDWRLA